MARITGEFDTTGFACGSRLRNAMVILPPIAPLGRRRSRRWCIWLGGFFGVKKIECRPRRSCGRGPRLLRLAECRFDAERFAIIFHHPSLMPAS